MQNALQFLRKKAVVIVVVVGGVSRTTMNNVRNVAFVITLKRNGLEPTAIMCYRLH